MNKQLPDDVLCEGNPCSQGWIMTDVSVVTRETFE